MNAAFDRTSFLSSESKPSFCPGAYDACQNWCEGFHRGVILSQAEFESITQVNCGAPHDLLGMHLLETKRGKADALVVRAFLQGVDACEVVDLADPEQRYPLERLSEDGLFEGVIEGRAEVFAYRLRSEQSNGEVRQFHDPYCFLPSR